DVVEHRGRLGVGQHPDLTDPAATHEQQLPDGVAALHLVAADPGPTAGGPAPAHLAPGRTRGGPAAAGRRPARGGGPAGGGLRQALGATAPPRLAHGASSDDATTRATARQRAPSPRPRAPMPSERLPFTVTGAPTASLRLRSSSALTGASLGRSSTTVQSTLAGAHPAARTSATARRSSSRLSAPARAGSVSGKCWPMSPSPAAPRRASVTAWATTSASLCPARPRSPGKVTPPRTRGRSGSSLKGCRSRPCPIRKRGTVIGRAARPAPGPPGW